MKEAAMFLYQQWHYLSLQRYKHLFISLQSDPNFQNSLPPMPEPYLLPSAPPSQKTSEQEIVVPKISVEGEMMIPEAKG
jgi:hypothetical protein